MLTAFDAMDAARAAAALFVLLEHGRNMIFLDFSPGLSLPWKAFYFVTGFGHQAVMIFFVLSGFWIAKTTARRIEMNIWSWRDYGIDRLTRLWVVLVPALVIGGGLDLIGRHGLHVPLYLGTQGTNTVIWDVGSRLTAANFLGSLAFLQTLLVDPLGSNGPLWSLANEFWYYCWFPVIYQLLRTRRTSLIALAVMLATMFRFSDLLPGFGCWLLGAGLFFVTRGKPAAANPLLVVPAALLLAAALAFARTGGRPLSYDLQDLLVSTSFALLLLAMLRSRLCIPRWLSPVCRFGASSSFSLYALHFPMLMLLCALFATPDTRLPASAHAMLLFLALTVAVAVYTTVLSHLTEARTAVVRTWIKSKFLGAAGTS